MWYAARHLPMAIRKACHSGMRVSSSRHFGGATLRPFPTQIINCSHFLELVFIVPICERCWEADAATAMHNVVILESAGRDAYNGQVSVK
jgi:hypothetical protein